VTEHRDEKVTYVWNYTDWGATDIYFSVNRLFLDRRHPHNLAWRFLAHLRRPSSFQRSSRFCYVLILRGAGAMSRSQLGKLFDRRFLVFPKCPE